MRNLPFYVLGFWLVLLFYLGFSSSGRPQSIVTNGHSFRVFYSMTFPSNLVEEAKADGSNRVYGETNCAENPVDNWIQIDPNQDLDDMKDTLWHEAKHASNDCAELKQTSMEGLYEEQNPQELRLLQDNPDLVKFILRRP